MLHTQTQKSPTGVSGGAGDSGSGCSLVRDESVAGKEPPQEGGGGGRLSRRLTTQLPAVPFS
jgi:hypothetical protein